MRQFVFRSSSDRVYPASLSHERLTAAWGPRFGQHPACRTIGVRECCKFLTLSVFIVVSPIDNARCPIQHHLSSHADAFPARLGVASSPSFRDRDAASLRSLRQSPPAPVDDHGGQDRPEDPRPPRHASGSPLPIPRPEPPPPPIKPIGAIKQVSIQSHRAGRAKLALLHRQPLQARQRAPAIGLSADPSQKNLLLSMQIGDSLI